MQNIAAVLQYDGSHYHGWQQQQNAVAVADVVERALGDILGKRPSIVGCSRTDAGVHALQYVCNFHADCTVPLDRLPLAVNTRLPADIRFLSCHSVTESFSARFCAKGKTYLYQVNTAKIASPFLSSYSFHVPYAVQLAPMQQAAAHLVGTHDFSAFMAAGGNQKTTIRTVRALDVTQKGDLIQFEITADAYLYKMVRIIAGTLLYVGRGKLLAHDIPDILKSGDRAKAGITAPPEGLFLKHVQYDKADLNLS